MFIITLCLVDGAARLMGTQRIMQASNNNIKTGKQKYITVFACDICKGESVTFTIMDLTEKLYLLKLSLPNSVARFPSIEDAEAHERTCTGPPAYTCDICKGERNIGMMFTIQSTL